MEHESLEYKIVLEDGADSEILGRLSALESPPPPTCRPLSNTRAGTSSFAGAPASSSHDGEPTPEPPKDPNLKSWSVHLITGSKMQHLGVVEAVTEAAAIEAAAVLFGLDDQRRKRLAVNPRS